MLNLSRTLYLHLVVLIQTHLALQFHEILPPVGSFTKLFSGVLVQITVKSLGWSNFVTSLSLLGTCPPCMMDFLSALVWSPYLPPSYKLVSSFLVRFPFDHTHTYTHSRPAMATSTHTSLSFGFLFS